MVENKLQHPSVTLLITLRNRDEHVKTFLSWFESSTDDLDDLDMEVVVIESDVEPRYQQVFENRRRCRYLFDFNRSVFHKTRLMNMGLTHANSAFVVPFDIDLVPVGNTLKEHILCANESVHLLITGYRLMANSHSPPIPLRLDALHELGVSPEDQQSALKKQLLGESFGVNPVFSRSVLLEIGAWDEAFVGWGAEDQDVIERYLAHTGKRLARIPSFLYVHLSHEDDPANWKNDELIERNRGIYYTKHK